MSLYHPGRDQHGHIDSDQFTAALIDLYQAATADELADQLTLTGGLTRRRAYPAAATGCPAEAAAGVVGAPQEVALAACGQRRVIALQPERRPPRHLTQEQSFDD
ncbi:MAG: hypothetical protein ACRDOY_00200 [Nocardioidaceae bacterium]